MGKPQAGPACRILDRLSGEARRHHHARTGGQAESRARGHGPPRLAVALPARPRLYRQKKAVLATEAGRGDVVEDRRSWRRHRQPRMREEPERLVLLDETATTTKMTRLRGRAKRGQRFKATAPLGHWGSRTFITALCGDGLTAPWIIKTAMSRTLFETYVETQLAPTLRPGDVVILDNRPAIRAKRPKPSSRSAAPGSSSCRPPIPTSTSSKWLSPSSKLISDASAPAPSRNCGKRSAPSATSTHPTSAEIISGTPGTRQIKRSKL